MKRRNFIQGPVGSALTAVFARSSEVLACGLSEHHLTGDDYLALPDGFRAQVISRAEEMMSDGIRTPPRPDGMACFADGPDHIILMRNHENYPDQNPAKSGGVSRIRLRSADLKKVSDNLVLTGTSRNCAGGISPWGWMTCEEDTDPGHGYVYLCDPQKEELADPVRISGYGRFNHEAATVHPDSKIAWLTEDRGDGCFYRFVPKNPDQNPFVGKLQALRVKGTEGFNTSKNLARGDAVAVDWVATGPDSAEKDILRYQAREKGAASFSRGEGLWLHDDTVYFSCTSGGPVGKGQIFALWTENGQEYLKVLSDAKSVDEMDMPDNITVSPSGVVYMAEDGRGSQYIRVIKPDGETKVFAKNVISKSEIAGICFDPSEQTMFLNIQEDGLTLAVRGPFKQFSMS